MVEPREVAMHTGIDHDIARPAVMMGFHAVKTCRTYSADVKLSEIDRNGFVFWSLIS
jgi:hypothetical protein